MSRLLPHLPDELAARLSALASDLKLPSEAVLGVTLLMRAALLDQGDEVEPHRPAELTRTQPDSSLDTGDLFGPPPALVRPNLGRYEELGLLGRGGAGDVWRAREPGLDRVVALKVLRGPLSQDPKTLARFRAEARVAASLRHPGIVVIYEAGNLPDHRPYYTMEEIRGRTLRELITNAHQGPSGVSDEALRALVRALRDAAQAIAYAHTRGVIHRDVKPSNIMVEHSGAVRVLDWGLFRYLLTVSRSDPREQLRQIEEVREEPPAREVVAGTPPYMAPEQLRGDREHQGPWTDVYALGAILFEILTGFPPLRAGTLSEVAAQVELGWREPMIARHTIPEDLRALCEHALAEAPTARLADAGLLAERLDAWLIHSARAQAASPLIREADLTLTELSRQRARAASLRFAAGGDGSHWSGVSLDTLRASWRMADEADRLDRERTGREAVLAMRLHGALARDPSLFALHPRLAALYRARLTELESRGGSDPLQEALLARHDQGRHRAWLQGDGSISLRSSPPGATVYAWRIGPLDLAPQPRLHGPLGVTPLERVKLPYGSWLLELQAPGHTPLWLPIQIGRAEHASSPTVTLAPHGALTEADRLIPPGPAWIGGDSRAPHSLPRRREPVSGFILRARPLSMAELRPGGDPELPAHGLSFEQATRIAAEIAAREGLPWRLPTEIEWERAARGADGRTFPWGSRFDPCFAATAEARLDGPAPFSAFALDRSVHGVEGLGGNIADWCTTEHGDPVARGGMWGAPANASRSAARHRLEGALGGHMVGLRLARSWPEREEAAAPPR